MATVPGSGLTERQRVLQRKGALWQERSSWLMHWREISEYQQPRLGRYMVTDVNKGWKRHNSIYDNTAIGASRTLAAGMMSGMTSPARPWFKMELADRELMEFGPVKSWLFQCTNLLRDIFARSNTYRSLHQGYEELGLFGTWATVVLPDFDNVIHHYPMTIGEYAIGTDHRGRVDTLGREFQMTVGQLVKQFGVDNCSTTVRTLYERNQLDAWVPVVHLIEPNHGREPGKRDNRNMPFASNYLELGGNEDKFLRQSGFKRFPGLAPRWAVTGNDIYGNSPGMEAQGDVKQLQHEQLRKSQAIDYQVNPPLQVPTQYKDAAKSRLPGGIMFADVTQAGGGIRSAFEVNLDLNHLLEDINDVRGRIRGAYYADLFMMLANDTRSGITATEVAERHEEKMLMIGPVLERLHDELLKPLIDITFDYCVEAGILPPAPKELQGVELNTEFISTLAQAQRIVSAQGMDRLLATVGNIAGLNPGVLDKIDFDQAIDDYGQMYGVNPEIIVPDDVVAKKRADAAKQAQLMQTAATMPQTVETAKTASEINPQNLQSVMASLQGYNTPGAQ
jgi:Bacteriophage head to tail connecting protein